MSEAKSISVVVPSHNSSAHLSRCLSAIRKSKFKDYELLVIDDGSTDNSISIAESFADRVVSLPKQKSRLAVRMRGFKASSGKILVNVDSDVELKTSSLNLIFDLFTNNPEVGAVTGLLTPLSPYHDFASAYKHVYMNYIFKNLPEQISFLYGSVFALSSSSAQLLLNNFSTEFLSVDYADDTEVGQFLVKEGVKIKLLKDLQVTHHKKFSLISLIKNDFRIPKDFARLLIKFGPSKPSLNGPVFLHASISQVLSIALAFLTCATFILSTNIAILLLLIWLAINYSFILSIKKYLGFRSAFYSIIFTFFDHLVMGAGILSGLYNGLKMQLWLENVRVGAITQSIDISEDSKLELATQKLDS